MTSHDRSGISRERGSRHPRWQQQRQRPLLDLPARQLQRCEVHKYIFSVITSGVICVLKLCYALRQTHILMTCTCNCSMHISANAALLHAHFTTCNCSMHIQHMPHCSMHISAHACNCSMHIQHLHVATRSGSPHNVLHSPSLFIYAAQFFPYQECNEGRPHSW